MIQFFLVVYSGFTHAFEADHLLAVSSIVTNRGRTKSAVKDGMYWGLGHTSTIILIGLLMILLKVQITEGIFHFFEAGVGLLLILLAVFRLNKFWRNQEFKHRHFHLHNQPDLPFHRHTHHLAYFVGLVHGLAGSGALVVLVMSQIQDITQGILYLSIFGFGSILGMFVASGLLSIPFTKKLVASNALQVGMILISCTLCIVFGGIIIHNNLA